jgi:O-acetylhomoserine (thiol)-lyase
MNFNTSLLHENASVEEKTGATLTPVYQSSAFAYQTAEELEKVFTHTLPGFSYTRINNPTVEAFEKRITAIEAGLASVACASGMAAVTNAILNIVQSGDEIISGAGIFGGTIDLFQDLEAYGIHTVYVNDGTPEEYESKITEKTKLIFAEVIGNPKLDVLDIEAVAGVAHRHQLPFLVDNTTATAFLVKPLQLGADIVINSSSKYINGSGNSISGIITDSGKFKWDYTRYPGLAKYKKFGPFQYIAKLRNGLFRNTGACLSPFNAYLNLLGLETMGIRMERISSNALALAKYLERNENIPGVNYPGLETSPWHEIAKKQFHGYYGGILTFRAGTKERAYQIMNRIKYAMIAPNIGDTKLLLIHPASTIYLNSTEEGRLHAGVYEDLVRVSVGLEDIEDLTWDFEQAIHSSLV